MQNRFETAFPPWSSIFLLPSGHKLEGYMKYLPRPRAKFQAKKNMANFIRDLKSRKYENSNLPRTLLDSLNEMRSTREHCDVFLRVKEQSFPAHRVVLASSSSYFRAMFSPSSSFTEAGNSEICLKSVDKRAVREVLDYFYTGSLEFNRLNFENVLILANLWDVPFLLSSSEDFIRQELHVSNCLGMQLLVKKLQIFSPSFQAHLDHFILDNFMAISDQQEFLSLSFDRLCEILENDLLRVKSEEMAFEAVCRWIQHDCCFRKQFMAELFKEVRFGLLSRSYLTGRVLSEVLVQQDSECRDFVLHVLQQESPDLDLSSKKRKINALYIFGGHMNHTGGKRTKVFSVQYLDCTMGKSHLEEFSRIRISACHVATLGHFIYFSSMVNKNILMRFNMLSLEWERHTDVSSYSASDTMSSVGCVCQQFMYIVGGSCYRRLNTATNLWQKLTLPAYEHYRPGVCCFNDKIYVISGCDKFYQEAVNHVERFDTGNKAWEMLSPLPTARWGASAAVMNKMIYVVGG